MDSCTNTRWERLKNTEDITEETQNHHDGIHIYCKETDCRLSTTQRCKTTDTQLIIIIM